MTVDVIFYKVIRGQHHENYNYISQVSGLHCKKTSDTPHSLGLLKGGKKKKNNKNIH